MQTLWVLLLVMMAFAMPAEAVLWPPDFEPPTIIETTLKSKHIVLGTVIDVSDTVWNHPVFDFPMSLVTFRIERDLLDEIARAENEEALDDEKEKISYFAQEGGKDVEIVGIPSLEVGDRAFLRIVPMKAEIVINGIRTNLSFEVFGGIYRRDRLQKNPKAENDPIVAFGWGGMHMTVSELARITRATLKRPKQMQSLERRLLSLKGTHGMRLGKLVMPPDSRMNIAFDEIKAIETELKLPPLPNPKKGGQK